MRGPHGQMLALVGMVALLGAAPAGAGQQQSAVEVVSLDVGTVPNDTAPALAASPADPRRLVGIGLERDVTTPGAGTCTGYVSRDGGASWTGAPLPHPEGTACLYVAPAITFSPDGVVHAAYVAAAAGKQGRVVVATSHDGGVTYGTPTLVPGTPREQVASATGAGITKPSGVAIAVVDGVVVVGWNGDAGGAQQGGGMWLARSTDGATSFAAPTPILTHALDREGGLQAHEPSLAVTGDRIHVLYAAWYNAEGNVGGTVRDGNPSHINYFWVYGVMHATSDDGGATWTDPVAIDQLIDYEGGSTSPERIATAASGDHVFAAWDDTADGTVNRRVYVTRSVDRGATWEPAISPWDGAVGRGIPHERPALAVAPDGRLDVAFYDGRNDPFSMQAFCPEAPHVCHGRDVYLASSHDKGGTFAVNRRVSDVTFEAVSRSYQATKRNTERLGSLGLAATAAGSVVLWERNDRTSGTGADRSQDTPEPWRLVARTLAVPDGASARPPGPAPVLGAPDAPTPALPSTGGGTAAFLLGGAVLALAASGRRRRVTYVGAATRGDT